MKATMRNLDTGVAAAFTSEQGRRIDNEDRTILLPSVSKMRALEGWEGEWEDGSREQLDLFSLAAVFDGHSGWRCSQFLAEHFAPQLVTHRHFMSHKKLTSALLEVSDFIGEQAAEMLRRENSEAGSTAIVAVYDGRPGKHILTVANVGDSVCVLSRSGRAVKLNRQHRTDHEGERERVTAAGGTIVNKRVNGVLAVTRAFGDLQLRGPVISTPEIYSEIITPMTEFAIIGSDGLWDVLSPQNAVNIARKLLSQKEGCDLQAVTQKLVETALSKGSVDNITVMIMYFHMPSGAGNGGSGGGGGGAGVGGGVGVPRGGTIKEDKEEDDDDDEE